MPRPRTCSTARQATGAHLHESLAGCALAPLACIQAGLQDPRLGQLAGMLAECVAVRAAAAPGQGVQLLQQPACRGKVRVLGAAHPGCHSRDGVRLQASAGWLWATTKAASSGGSC